MAVHSAVFEAVQFFLVDESAHGVLLVLGGEAQTEGLCLEGGSRVHIGLQSTATVHYHLGALREAGLIEMDDMKKRAITLPDAHRADRIPVVGVVTAGVPILAVENIEGYIPWEGEAGCFALRVRGDSMIGAGILDGDKVVIRPQQTATNGEIVVALLEDSATVKRFQKTGKQVWLLPENPAYQPIDGNEAQILGKVKAVIRTY